MASRTGNYSPELEEIVQHNAESAMDSNNA